MTGETKIRRSRFKPRWALLLPLALVPLLLHNLPQQEANVAYLIQLTRDTLPLLPRLLCKLHHDRNVHLLHFDTAIPQPDINRTLSQLPSRCLTGVHVLPRRAVTYDGISMVLNTLSAMSHLRHLQKHGVTYDFFINLSGADYPLCTPRTVRVLLHRVQSYRPVFISLANRTRWKSEFLARARHFHMDDALSRSQSAPNSRLHLVPHANPVVQNVQFQPAYSEAWLIAHRSFAEYVTEHPDARHMLLAMANMRGADEFFFATLAYNHRVFNASIIPKGLRKIVWQFEGRSAGQHPFYLDDKDEQGRYVFLDQLKSSTAFHARKFRVKNSPLMEAIDAFAVSDARERRTTKMFDRLVDALVERRRSAVLRGDVPER